ncbi:MAG: M23 family metallopeptidase [Ruminococcaceae bacterium]|nr:M23 family metallopeptidase [Oscillospiraceae bacterium]
MNNNPKRKKAQNQSVYVTIVVIMMMVAVVIAIAVALAKESKDSTSLLEGAADTTGTLIMGDKENDSDAPSKDNETDDVFFNESDKDTDKNEENDNYDDQSAKDSESEQTVVTPPANILPQFHTPVNGEVLKACSLTVPVFSQTMEDYRTHTGVDLYCSSGCDISAAADGTIIDIKDDPMMGMSISIEHSGGAVSTYQNLYDELPTGIEVGKTVKMGQVIATAGNTALEEIAEECHLHFELSVNGKAVDPAEYIDFPEVPSYEE